MSCHLAQINAYKNVCTSLPASSFMICACTKMTLKVSSFYLENKPAHPCLGCMPGPAAQDLPGADWSGAEVQYYEIVCPCRRPQINLPSCQESTSLKGLQNCPVKNLLLIAPILVLFLLFFLNWAPFVCQTHPFLGMSEKSPTCMEFACKGWASINTKTIQWDNHWSWDAKWSGDGENGWSRMQGDM